MDKQLPSWLLDAASLDDAVARLRADQTKKVPLELWKRLSLVSSFDAAAYAVLSRGLEVPDYDRIETTATGAHITQHMHTWILYRDSQGRRRMETPIVITPGGQPALTIIEMRDYVGGYEFTLDPVNKIAHRMRILPRSSASGLTVLPSHSEYPTQDVPQSARVTLRSESLGPKVLEGVETSGSRETRSVPAGVAGNDQAVTYVSEDWWSRDLQLSVLSRQVDPVGTATVRSLTNIRTSEPDTELFVVPEDYKIVDETGRFDVKVIIPSQSH